jgi:hypothetical protein
MTHIELVIHFRRVRKKIPFTNVEADLYYELIALWNENYNENPFQYPNALLCATLGVSEKTLINARNRIKQAGLIEYRSGQKRSPTVYKIIYCKISSTNDSICDSTNDSISFQKGSASLKDKSKTETKQPKTKYVLGEKPEALKIENREIVFVDAVNASDHPPEIKNGFIRYWTERNGKGNKMKFEMQQTFEISKRLATWALNDQKFKTEKKDSAQKKESGFQTAKEKRDAEYRNTIDGLAEGLNLDR